MTEAPAAGGRDARQPLDSPSLTYDVIVLGGGVNGTGTARDLAMRGLSVLLLEKADSASARAAPTPG